MHKNIHKFAVMGFVLSGLAACAGQQSNPAMYIPKHEKVRVPYHFLVKKFTDDRLPNRGGLANVITDNRKHSFDREMFLRELVHNMNTRDLYDYAEAELTIKLKDYAAVKEGRKYTVSFYADIIGRDAAGRRLAGGTYSCYAKENTWFGSVHESVAEVVTQAETFSRKEDSKVWKKLYQDCLSEIAYNFNNQVLESGRR